MCNVYLVSKLLDLFQFLAQYKIHFHFDPTSVVSNINTIFILADQATQVVQLKLFTFKY